jgi:hypothetical protein
MHSAALPTSMEVAGDPEHKDVKIVQRFLAAKK